MLQTITEPLPLVPLDWLSAWRRRPEAPGSGYCR